MYSRKVKMVVKDVESCSSFTWWGNSNITRYLL